MKLPSERKQRWKTKKAEQKLARNMTTLIDLNHWRTIKEDSKR